MCSRHTLENQSTCKPVSQNSKSLVIYERNPAFKLGNNYNWKLMVPATWSQLLSGPALSALFVQQPLHLTSSSWQISQTSLLISTKFRIYLKMFDST